MKHATRENILLLRKMAHVDVGPGGLAAPLSPANSRRRSRRRTAGVHTGLKHSMSPSDGLKRLALREQRQQQQQQQQDQLGTPDKASSGKGKGKRKASLGLEQQPRRQRREGIENLSPSPGCKNGSSALISKGGSAGGGGGGGGIGLRGIGGRNHHLKAKKAHGKAPLRVRGTPRVIGVEALSAEGVGTVGGSRRARSMVISPTRHLKKRKPAGHSNNGLITRRGTKPSVLALTTPPLAGASATTTAVLRPLGERLKRIARVTFRSEENMPTRPKVQNALQYTFL